MALPAGVATCTVTWGKAMDVTGEYAAARLEITPDRPLVWAATADRISQFTAQRTADAGAPGTVAIPQDQDGFVDANDPSQVIRGWYYTARMVQTLGRSSLPPVVKRFQIVEGQTSIDLDMVPDGPVTPGVTAPLVPVTSVNGQTGAVDIDASTLDAVSVSEKASPLGVATLTAGAKLPESQVPERLGTVQLAETFATREELDDATIGSYTPGELAQAARRQALVFSMVFGG